MMQIKLENGTAKVFTPYNAEFVSKIKGIGGRRWDSADRCWCVPESEIETVRQFMQEVYGETDQPNEGEKVTARIIFNSEVSELRESVVLFGKTIARAWGRDSGARVGDDVTLVSGKISSGGSMKNWYTVVEEGSVVLLRNVPKALLSREADYDVTIEEIQSPAIDRAALLEEKARLQARLEEIEKLLAE